MNIYSFEGLKGKKKKLSVKDNLKRELNKPINIQTHKQDTYVVHVVHVYTTYLAAPPVMSYENLVSKNTGLITNNMDKTVQVNPCVT
jgi:hypothetical protein